LYNKVFKNYQINLGAPFQVKVPVNLHTIKHLEGEIVLENEDAESLTLNSTEGILQKANEEAELILKEAELEARRILDNAESEADLMRKAAEKEARQKGYNEGLEQARKQYEDMLEEAELIRENAKTEYGEVLSGIETDVVNMILDISKKVIGREISENKDSILSIVRQAFEKCANRDSVVVKVSPGDYDFLEDNRDRLDVLAEWAGEFDIKKDPALKTGDCIVETPYGSIDAGVNTKMRKIEEAFRQLMSEAL